MSKLGVTLLYSFSLLLLSTFKIEAQTAVAYNSSDWPAHLSIDQRTIIVYFDNFVAGTTSTAQWTVQIDPDGAGPLTSVNAVVTAVGNSSGTFGATATPPLNSQFFLVRFDATSITGHSASTPYLLPGERLYVSFTNTGSTVTTQGSGNVVPSFSNYQSKNYYSPTPGLDILYQSEGIASVLDQCSPVNTDFFRWTYLYSLRYRNSSRWNTNNNQLRVNWGSGGSTSDLGGYLSNSGGDPSATQQPVNIFTGGNPGVYVSFRTGINLTSAATGAINVDGTNSFIYPDNTGVCNFRTTQYPIGIVTAVYSAAGSPTLQRNTQFNSYDYDDQNTGTLSMQPSIPPVTATSELVCLGSNVGVQFTDNSTFNCIGDGTNIPTPGQGAASTPINNQQRWVRIIYGGANSATPANVIPNIQVGGVPVTDASGALDANWDNVGHPILPGSYTDMTPNGSPMDRGYVFTGGGADANGVITLPANATVPSVVSQLITTSSPVGQAVGQRFYVTLQYWGVCNPYPSSAPVEISVDYVEIITKPIPPVAVNKDFCFDQNMAAQSFEITSAVGGRTAVNWYNSNPTLGGATLLANPNGGNALTFPAQAATAGFTAIPNSVPAGGTYSLWATQVVGGTNACESDPVEVIIRKREELSAPGAISNTDGTTFPVCAGTTGIDFTVPAAAGTTLIGGAAEYLWSVTAGTATINGSTTGQTVVIDVPAGASGTQTISVVRRYTTNDYTGSRCTTSAQTFNFTVDPTSVGGTVSGPTDICAGQNTGLITLSGNTGSITRWQVNGANDATLGTSNPINPTINASGSYVFQAFVKSGVCPEVGSTTNLTVTVAAVPGKPSVAAAPSTTVCEGNSITLTAGNVGATTYNWFKEPTAWQPNNASSATLHVWYKADAGVTTSGADVTQWNDQVGTRNLAQGTGGNRPDLISGALNGLPVVDFDGTDDFLRNASLGLGTNSITLFTVAKSDVAGQTDVLVDISDNTTQTDRRLVQLLDASNFRSRLTNNGSTSFNASRAFTDISGYHIFYTDHLTSGNVKGSVDGIPLFITAANGTLRNANNINLGRSFASNREFDGKIAEVIIFQGVVSLAERQRVEGYLAHKWGLTANLPADHPYKNTAPLNTVATSGISFANLDTPGESGTYRVQAIGSAPTSCVSEPSNPITITINPRPTAANPTGGGAVCSGIAAPDIVWTLTGTPPFNITYSVTHSGGMPIAPVTITGYVPSEAVAPYTFRIVSPNPPVDFGIGTGNFTYQMTSLQDDNACSATALGATAVVSISTTAPPSVESFNPTAAVCDDGVATNPPDAVLDLLPNSSETYSITYRLRKVSDNSLSGLFTIASIGSDASGIVNISPTYADMGGAADASGYRVELSSIVNTSTGCAGSLPIISNPLIINPRPPVPTGATRGIACSSGGGTAISVDDPGAGFSIAWSSTAAPVFTDASGLGTVGGTNGNTFAPTSSATATFYAFNRNTTTLCLSAASLAVQHIQDVAPTASNAGTPTANCTGTFVLNANVPGGTEIGTWTVPGIGYQQAFANYSNGTLSSTAINGWTIDTSGAGVFSGGSGSFQVNSNQFEANNTDGSGSGGAEVIWRSSVISGAFTNRNVSIALSSSATLEASDYIRVYYRIDGGAETLLTNGNQTGNIAGTVTATASGLSGATSFQLVVRVNNSAADEFHYFDNILISSTGAPTLSNPNDPTATVTNLPVGANVLTWSISTQYGVCSPSTSTVTLTRNSLPTVVNPTPAVCEDSFGAGFVNNINLNAYSNTITALPGTYVASGVSAFESVGAGQDDRRIEWFINSTRTVAVPNASDVDGLVSSAKRYYRVTIVSTGCTSDGEITFTVNPLPVANNRTYTYCSDALPGNPPGSNQATVNLNTIPNTDILGAGPPANRQLSYHNTLADAQAGINPITSLIITANTDVFARVRNTSTNCVNTSTIQLVYQSRAANNQIIDAANNILVDGLTGVFTGTKSICASGSLVLFQIDPSRNPGATYNWSIPAVSYAGEFELLTGTNNYFIIMKFPNATSLGTSLYNGGIPITVTETLGTSCSGNPLTLSVSVDATPAKPIISGPAEVCENGLATYTITSGAGAPNTWSIPPGATITNSPTGASINVQMGTFDGQITVTASGGSGCVSPTSDPVNVDVIPRPSFTFTNAPLCSGSNVSSAVTLTPSIAAPLNVADVRFTWEATNISGSVTGPTIGVPTSNVTSINQVLTNVSGVAGSVLYRVTPVGPAATLCQGTAQNITVTVNPEPVLALTNKTICSDEPAAYEIKVTPANLPAGTQFSWAAPAMSSGGPQGSSGTNVAAGVAGTIHINDTFTNTTNATITATYVISASSSITGCSSNQAVPDRTVVITIAPKPVVSTTLNTTVCSDAAIGLSLAVEAGSVAATTYEIVSRTVPGGLVSSGSNVAVPATGVASNYVSGDKFTNTTNGSLVVTYVVRARGSINNCLSDTRSILVTINPEPVIATNLNATRCSDAPIALTLATNGTSVAALDYTIVSRTIQAGLTANGGNVGVPASNVADTYLANDRFTNTTNGVLTVTYVVEARGTIGNCPGDQRTIVITIDPKPVVATGLDANRCSDSAIGLTLATNGISIPAANYNIVSRTVQGGLTANGANVVVPAANVAANYLANDRFTNLTPAPLTVTYVVEGVGTINSCVSDQRTIVMTIDPEPVVSNTLGGNRCSDDAIALNLTTEGTSVTAASYNIISRTVQASLVSNVGNVGVPSSGVAAGFVANDVFTNTTSGNLTVTYVVQGVGSINGCLGDQRSIVMTINPKPVVATTLNATRCSDAPIGLVLNTNGISVGALNYNIISRTVQAGLVANGSNVVVPAPTVADNYLSGDRFTNTTATALTVTYRVEARGLINNCLSTQQDIVITINPEPVVATTLDNTRCSDTAIGLVLTTNGTSVGALNYNIVSRTIQAGLVPAGANVAVPANGVAANYLNNDRFTNTTGGSLTVIYVVEGVGLINGCVGDQRTITMTIDPEPVVSASLNDTECSDVAIGLVLDTEPSSVSASNYNIISRTLQAGLAANAGNVGVPANAVAANYLTNDRFTNTTTGSLTVTYVVEARGSINSCVGDQRSIILTINPEPVVASTLSATKCSDEAIGLTLSTEATAIGAANYNIISRTIQAGLVAAGANAAVPFTGAGTTYLSGDRFTNTTSGSLTVTYVVQAVGLINNCLSDQRTIVMTIDPEPVVSPLLNDTKCSDVPIGLVLNTNGTSISASSYNIVSRTAQAGLVSAGTNVAVPASNVASTYLSNDRFTNTTAGSLTVTYVVEARGAINSCLGDQRTIVMTIAPEPVVSNALNANRCSDTPIALTLATAAGSVTALNYNIVSRTIQAGLVANGGNVSVPAANVAGNYLANDRFTNTTAAALTVSYVVEATGTINGCVGDQRTVTITIDPEPVVSTNLNARQCHDEPIGLVLNTNGSSIGAANYNIISRAVQAGLTGNGGNVAVPATGVANNYLASDRFTNSTTGSLTVTYVVEAVGTINSCVGDQRTIVITIDPKPVVSTTLDNTKCSDEATALTLTTAGGSVSASGYNIISRTTQAGLTANGSNVSVPANNVSAGYLSNDRFTNTTGGNLTVTYVVEAIGTINGCVSSQRTIVMTINPIPVMATNLNETKCSDESYGRLLATNGSSVAAISYDVTADVSEFTTAGLTATPTTGTGLAANAIQNDVFTNTTNAQLRIFYTVTPNGPAGCIGAAKVVELKVNPEPVLLNPGLDRTVCSDVSTGLALSTNGTSVAATTYRITAFTTNGLTENASNVVKTTSLFPVTVSASQLASEKFTNGTSANVNVEYTVVPIGPPPSSCVGDPLVVRVTVKPEPRIVPGAVPVCSGETVGTAITLGPDAGSVVPDQFELKKIVNAANLPTGGTNAGLGIYNSGTFLQNDIFINTIDANSRDVVYEIVPLKDGCRGEDASGFGKLVTLTVNPAPDLADNLGKTVCSGEASGISLSTRVTPTASAAAANYNITSVVVDAGLVPGGGVNLTFPRNGRPANELSADQFTNPTNGVLNVTYKVVPVTSFGCRGVEETIVLRVEPTVTMIIPANVQTCSDSPNSPNGWSILLNSNTTPSAGNITFDYSATSSPVGSVTGFLISQSNLPRLTNIADKLVNTSNNVATVTYSITPRALGAKNGAGCSAAVPTLVTVTVEPKPRLSISPSTQTVCEGAPSSMVLSSTTVPGTGTLQFTKVSAVATGGMTLVSAPKTVYLNGESIADSWNNPTTLTQTVTYTFRSEIVGGLGCVSEDITVVLTVNPRPTITASAQPDVCSGESINITLTPDVANTVAAWTVSAPSIIGASNGAGNQIFQTLFNSGATVATASYTVTPKVNGCDGTPLVINIGVNPKPVITGLVSPVTVCHGATLNVTLNNTVASPRYIWTVDNPSGLPGITDQTTAGPGIIAQPMLNTSGSQATLTYTITPYGPTACQGDQKIMIVNVAPQMAASFINTDASICKGSAEFLIVQIDGQAPFELVYNDGASDIAVPNSGNFKVIRVTPTVSTTYTIKSIKDAFGCSTTIPAQSVRVNVGETDATFSVVGDVAACGPYTATFQFNQVAGTEYTWQWFDGSADDVSLASTSVPNQTISHTFTNPNPNGAITYKVTLRTQLPAPFPGCFKSSTRTITVLPSMITNVFAEKDVICSDESIQFFNQSFGVTTHKWFYRARGSNTELDVKSTTTANFRLVNTTGSNPLIYEVVYRASNGNCPTPDVIIPITVYRSITAGFDEGTIPPYISGNSRVTFTNTSSPVDASQFRYEWNFGLNGTPLTSSGAGPFAVDYSTPGSRDVTLKATNVAAETAGLTCASEFSKTITVPLLPLVANFTATPVRSCFPSKISVTSNTSTGDVMEWRLVDSNGRVAGTSQTVLPVFNITNPGKYSLFLTTRSSLTGQVANTQQTNFEVFDKPVASFQLRPTTVYVPDTEMATFNFSTGATDYVWDFGDGGTSDQFEPVYKYKIEGVYDVTLIAQYDHGEDLVCADTTVNKVTAKQGGITRVPNAFTPSGNGSSGGVPGNGGLGQLNDVFLPIVKGVEEFNMQIFDRWGNLIFESNSAQIGWDGYDKNGRLMPSGVYVYKLTLRLSDGQRTTQVGDITMIR